MKNTKRGTAYILKKVVIGLLAAVFVYIVLSLALSPFIYRTIFAAVRTDGFSFSYDYDDAADKYPRKSVSFDSNGMTLRGFMYQTDEPCATVIIAGGVGSNADAHLAEIMYFVDHGFDVFAYDGTGMGRSEGESIIGLSQMRLDLLAAIESVKEASSLPICLYGHSAGGYAAAAVSDTDGVAAVVSVAAFNSPVETMTHMAKRYAGIIADTGVPFMVLEHRRTFGEDGFIEAIDVINATDTPVEVYYGRDDATIDESISLYAHKDESVNPNAVFYLTDGGHSDIWFTKRARSYLAVKRDEYALLEQTYGKTLPADVRADFTDGIRYSDANELNEAFMAHVTEFFTDAVKGM